MTFLETIRYKDNRPFGTLSKCLTRKMLVNDRMSLTMKLTTAGYDAHKFSTNLYKHKHSANKRKILFLAQLVYIQVSKNSTSFRISIDVYIYQDFLSAP